VRKRRARSFQGGLKSRSTINGGFEGVVIVVVVTRGMKGIGGAQLNAPSRIDERTAQES
jgi:hypothetical protein